MEINNLGDGSNIAETELNDLDFPARLGRIQMVIPFEFVSLPQPGSYEVVVLLDGQPLARQHFDAEIDDGRT